MLKDLINEMMQTLVVNAIPGVNKAQVMADLKNNLTAIDEYVSKHGTKEIFTLPNPMHGAMAFDLLRKSSSNEFIPIYAYILYTQALHEHSVGGEDNINEVLLKKTYILIGSKWPAVRALLMMGCMGTTFIQDYELEDLVNILILGTLLNMSGPYLQNYDKTLYQSMQQMRPKYKNVSDDKIKSISNQVDSLILSSKDMILH